MKKKLLRKRLFGLDCFDEVRGSINIFEDAGTLVYSAAGGNALPVTDPWVTWLLGRSPWEMSQPVAVPDHSAAVKVRNLIKGHPNAETLLPGIDNESNPLFTVMTDAFSNHFVRPAGLDPSSFDQWCSVAGLKGPTGTRMHGALELLADLPEGFTANYYLHCAMTQDFLSTPTLPSHMVEMHRKAQMIEQLGAIELFERMQDSTRGQLTERAKVHRHSRQEVKFTFKQADYSEDVFVVDRKVFAWSDEQALALARDETLTVRVDSTESWLRTATADHSLIPREMGLDILLAAAD